MTPAIINPIKLGIRSLRSKTGDSKIINSIIENNNTGSFMGNSILGI
jgi:hypothetical protein